MYKQPTKSDWYIIVLFFTIGCAVTFNGYNYGKGLWVPFLDTVIYTIATFFLTYLIVYKLFPIFFPKKQILRLFVSTLSLMIIFGVIELFAYRLVDGRPLAELMCSEVVYWAITSSAENAGILIGILLGKKFYDAQIEIEKRESEKRESELRLLKSQVDPHFLFNNLNTLDSLIDRDPKVAKEYLNHLSRLYRYLIQTKDDEVVDLMDELEFARNYIFLIEKRFGNAYKFRIKNDIGEVNKLIPPSSIQAAIENVVKHNSAAAGSHITTIIDICEDRVIVSNNAIKKPQRNQSTGTGLSNLKKRYRFLTDQEIIIKEGDDYTIELPLINIVE